MYIFCTILYPVKFIQFNNKKKIIIKKKKKTYSVRWWGLLDEGNYDAYHQDTMPYFSISGTGSFICPDGQTLLDIPRPLIIQSWTTAWTPGKVEPFSHEGRRSARSRIRTHWGERITGGTPYRAGHRGPATVTGSYPWRLPRPCVVIATSIYWIPPSPWQLHPPSTSHTVIHSPPPSGGCHLNRWLPRYVKTALKWDSQIFKEILMILSLI